MSLRTYRLGTPRHPSEGRRIGGVRYWPRGMKKEETASPDFAKKALADCKLDLLGLCGSGHGSAQKQPNCTGETRMHNGPKTGSGPQGSGVVESVVP